MWRYCDLVRSRNRHGRDRGRCLLASNVLISVIRISLDRDDDDVPSSSEQSCSSALGGSRDIVVADADCWLTFQSP